MAASTVGTLTGQEGSSCRWLRPPSVWLLSAEKKQEAQPIEGQKSSEDDALHTNTLRHPLTRTLKHAHSHTHTTYSLTPQNTLDHTHYQTHRQYIQTHSHVNSHRHTTQSLTHPDTPCFPRRSQHSVLSVPVPHAQQPPALEMQSPVEGPDFKSWIQDQDHSLTYCQKPTARRDGACL